MIRVRFKTDDDARITGFHLSGHAGAGEYGQDIVCAAVSSAAYMTANTILEIVNAPVSVSVQDGLMDLTVLSRIDNCQDILSGFQLHLQALAEQYPKRIQLN